ncbi:hypothetical protein ACHQM5_009383 [Ranunculus cassubicifolius]
MASSPLNPKTSYHVRSISLPSSSHPLILNVEEHLCRLRSSESTSCSSSTFDNLSALYESVEDLVSKKAVCIDKSNTCVSDVFDGSLRLLDICSTTREVFSQVREYVQDLQSALRRNRELSLEKDFGVYMVARKNLKKMVQKCLSDLKKAIKKNEDSIVQEKDQCLVAILSVLKEVESITLSTFRSLLSTVSSSRSLTKTSGWSLVSKLTQSKRVSCDGEDADIFAMEKLDSALSSLVSKKISKGTQVMNVEIVQNILKEVESSMQGLDDKLECIYKSLIRTRFSLLNILSQ